MLSRLKDHLEKVHYLVKIAEVGTLREAARHLRVTQPTLTHAVQALEGVLDTPLLLRSKQGVSLTQAGRAVVRFGEKMISDVENLELQIRNPEDQWVGHLTVGTYESLAIRVWPKVLKHFSETYPQVRISLISGDRAALLERVQSGKLHVAWITGPVLDPALKFQVLYEDSFCFYRQTTDESLPFDIDHLSALPLILVDSRQCYLFDVEKYIFHLGIHHRLIYRLDTFEAAREFVVAGIGNAVLPTRVAEPAVQERKITGIKLDSLGPSHFGNHSVGMVWHKDAEMDPLVKLMRQHQWRF